MRDNNGRFKKVDKGEIIFRFGCPSIKKILLYALLLIILLPWITIFLKWEIPKKVLDFTEKLLKFNEIEKEETKKNGIFY